MTIHGRTRRILAALVLGAWALSAQALQLASVRPQGEVAQVRQLVLRFDADVVPAGRTDAPAPATLRCNGAAPPAGSARWAGPRQWNYDFQDDLPPGLRCEVTLSADLKSLQGEALQGERSLRFSTGGPFVQQLRPYPDSEVDEDQTFVLRLNGPATTESLLANTYCVADGLGERVPVRPVQGAERDAILRALRWDRQAAAAPLRIATVSCNRRLTPGTRVQLVFGKGVVAPAPAGVPPASMPQSVEKRYDFQVRGEFSASFSCERENAQAACLPIRGMSLQFSAPVARSVAMGVRLAQGGRSLSPVAPEAGAADAGALVDSVRFAGPFAENTRYTLTLPIGLQDAAGRPLRNADSFPMQVATGSLPPLAKFPASPFGIVERFAEPDGTVLLPVTLRKVEAITPAITPAASPAATPAASGAQVRDLLVANDADIIAWYRRVQRYDEGTVSRKLAATEASAPLPPPTGPDDRNQVQARMLSLLQGRSGVRSLALPQSVPGDPRSFEVVGIPLTPGFHVVEIASPLLGAALLDPAHGERRTMYVRTAALVTNLAVHFKLGRENALAWVTTLDRGQPVANARVRVSDCRGREVAQAISDAQGIARFEDISPEPPECTGEAGYARAYFVSARAAQPAAREGRAMVEDMAFTWSDWQRGIEPWRFQLPTDLSPEADLRAHTILDRTLLRVGETVSMKHLLRQQSLQGFSAVATPPTTVFITHVGSGQKQSKPLAWRRTATGGQSAESSFALPAGSKLGQYEVALGDAKGERLLSSGSFRVEAFRLPVLRGSVTPVGGDAALVAPKNLPVDVQLQYVQGGPAARMPVTVSALLRDRYPSYGDYESFRFQPPRPAGDANRGDEDEDGASTAGQQVVADKRALVLDASGTGRLPLDALPAITVPRELLLEATYADPNGEIQTLRSVHTLWPAGVVAGIRAEDWIAAGRSAGIQALALDLQGKPRAGVPLEVRAQARIVTSSRKRLVGGFYAYENHTELRDLGSVCSGKSDAQGLLHCEAPLKQPGEVELIVRAQDPQGRSTEAATSVYVTRQGELWFGGENHDRIDLVPEQRSYEPGQTARLQVRMPFRQATALLAVEREGIIETQVLQLRGDNPTVEVKIGEDWGPNVYVSVLALRGRLREVPWYSFFTWGYKAPRAWWTTFWYEGRSYTAPTALVDLSKPAFRLGVAELRVGLGGHQLDVKVQPDAASYAVRSQAQVSIRVQLPDGKPAANAEVALAAVDEALLELMPNTSWNLLDAMLQRRSWGVETSTAQMEIIGRRHYGRKAVPAGGGGGQGGTRELLDTLLLWNPRVQLDAQGQARVTVPLNDSLTSFRIVAVADAGLGLFGTGQASIRTAQDLQIISGLPPVLREGDQFRAQFTLRNTTAADMQVQLQARAAAPYALAPAPQAVTLPAGQARDIVWDLAAPSLAQGSNSGTLAWDIQATATGAKAARDALRVQQQLLPAVPMEVQQASLQQVDGTLQLPVQPPAAALPERGGLRLGLQATLANAADGGPASLRAWFEAYTYSCLEQSASKALGLRDAARWQAVLERMPAYLDEDGLAYYFPPGDGVAHRGSDVLAAYLLSASAEAARLNPTMALTDALRERLAQGLVAFVEGRIQRKAWSPQSGAGTDLDVRKLAALEALSRHGLATGRMTTSITVTPNQWPSHALIDWLLVLQRVEDVPQRAQRIQQATQVLRARVNNQGVRTVFSTEVEDHWWWQMQDSNRNAARLLLLAMDDPAWKDEVTALASGLVGRQQRGHWGTTTANLWASLALQQFSRRYESTPVTGSTQAQLGAARATVDWTAGAPRTAFLPWGANAASAPQTLQLQHQGSGRPWLSMEALAAVPRTTPMNAGYHIARTVTPVEQANPRLPAGSYTRGDVLRITLEVNAAADMTWVALRDAIPAGATILGSGLGRDSQIASGGETRSGQAWPAYEERAFDALRAYYEWMPKGRTTLQYTVRLNTVGDFALPPARVEALYAPEVMGEAVQGRIKVTAP